MEINYPKPLRVAVYIRFGSDLDHLHQDVLRQFYIDLIGGIPNGTIADFYVDEGPGTTRNRPELQRLLADCHAGFIDQVVTKSISCLSRNTFDALALCREINGCGSTICFEKEGLVVGCRR
jgi:DNA invertase Pin-like site-specific DNA recombinase